jgi:hypothetical protein
VIANMSLINQLEHRLTHKGFDQPSTHTAFLVILCSKCGDLGLCFQDALSEAVNLENKQSYMIICKKIIESDPEKSGSASLRQVVQLTLGIFRQALLQIT